MSLREVVTFTDSSGHVGTVFHDVDDETGDIISTHLQIDSPNGDAGPVACSMQFTPANAAAIVSGLNTPLTKRGAGKRRVLVDLDAARKSALAAASE